MGRGGKLERGRRRQRRKGGEEQAPEKNHSRAPGQ